MTKRPITGRLLSCASDPLCRRKRPVDLAITRIRTPVAWLASFAWGLCAFSLVLLLVPPGGFADEGPASPSGQLEQTNSREALQLLLQIQDQLRSNRMVIEQNALEAREAAARNAEALAKGLQTIETVFSSQQEAFSVRTARELKAVQDSNQAMLIVSGTCAAVAALAMVVIAYFQRRMSKALARLSALSPVSWGLARGSPPPVLAAGGPNLIQAGAVEDSNRILLGAMERLARRIENLENSSKPVLQPQTTTPSLGDNGASPPAPGVGPVAEGSAPAATDGPSRISVLLAQGQSRLKENDMEAAIKCFDELLSLDPNHSEALVRKGAALERLKKLNEAFECYDRAIAADASMSVAYLHKGGLCNRLERFKEALECYEKALQTHDERRD